jgi:hypothetical protein
MTQSDDTSRNDGGGGAPPAATSPNDDSVERAFELLQQAKSLEANKDFWKASEVYVQARQLLQALADEAACTSPEETNYEEQQQISILYSDKAQEYWSQSRQCLIQAMEQEKKKDEDDVKKDRTASPSCNLIDDDQAEARNQTFSALFSRTIAEKVTNIQNDENIIDQQWSIEERLQELNKSLPSGFKTDDERMAEINKGLNKLGLSLPHTQQKPFARFQDALPKSEEEQIDDIMAQAQDEAVFEQHQERMSGIGGASVVPLAKTHDDDEADLSNDDDDSDDESGDEELEDDQLAIKKIRKKVVKAQVKIAELVALLDEANAAAAKESKPITKETVLTDDDSDDRSDVAGILEPGKKKLRSARRDLRKALEEWNDAILVGTKIRCLGIVIKAYVSNSFEYYITRK